MEDHLRTIQVRLNDITVATRITFHSWQPEVSYYLHTVVNRVEQVAPSYCGQDRVVPIVDDIMSRNWRQTIPLQSVQTPEIYYT